MSAAKPKKGAADAAPTMPVEKAQVFVVAPGKAITSARGVLEPGTVVDFLDAARIADLVAAGYLVEA